MTRHEKFAGRSDIRLLDVVELGTSARVSSVRAGSLGTVVDVIDDNVYVVEFCDEQGRAIAVEALPGTALNKVA